MSLSQIKNLKVIVLIGPLLTFQLAEADSAKIDSQTLNPKTTPATVTSPAPSATTATTTTPAAPSAAALAASKAALAEEPNASANNQSWMKFLSAMSSALGTTASPPAAPANTTPATPTLNASGQADSGVGASSYGTGTIGTCSTLPDSVRTALGQAMAYRTSCKYANRGADQKIAVNDYSTSPPSMYIFNSSGTCIMQTLVSCGCGPGGPASANATSAEPCSSNGDHFTPPGFHLTGVHDAQGRYNRDNSLMMVSLEGQGSAARGVLIHPTPHPGSCVSWGCSGVGPIGEVKSELGIGALVYNYFGSKSLAPGCNDSAGFGNNHSTCHLETSVGSYESGPGSSTAK